MDGPTPTTHAQRRSVAWILWSAVCSSVLVAIAVVLWLGLPSWSPAFVINQSPWVDPALRAATVGNPDGTYRHVDIFLFRVDDWGAAAAPALIRALASSNERQRFVAVHALLRLVGQKKLNGTGCRALIAMVSDARGNTQMLSVVRLGELADELGEAWTRDLGDQLILLLSSEREAVREMAIMQLTSRAEDGQLTEAQIARLMGLLHDERAAIRMRAVALLAEVKTQTARDAVVAALRDPDAKVASHALMMVADRRPEEATPLLITLLEGPRDPPLAPGLRAQALESLIRHYDAPGKLPALIHACAEDDPALRLLALGGLQGGYPGDAADAAVRTLLHDRDAEVASAALGVAAQRHLADALPLLIAALAHADASERHEAIDMLVTFGGPRLIELLSSRLHDESPQVRMRVAWGLGESGEGGNERAVTPLLTLLDDSVCRVRMAAVTALRRYVEDPRIADAILGQLEADRLRPGTGDLPQKRPRELEEAEWFNEVIGVIDARQLTDEQRRRLPERKPTPRAGFGGGPVPGSP